ncbi:MAG: glycosyltransferase [Promethearchaeota archaeon]
MPCIATKVGGVLEVITHEKDGLLVESGNPEAISAAVLHLISKPKKRKCLANMLERG